MFSESGKVIVTHHFSYILNCVASAAQQFGCTFQTYAPDKFADGEISECLYPAVEGGLTDDHNVCQLFHVEIGVFHVFIDNSHDFYDERIFGKMKPCFSCFSSGDASGSEVGVRSRVYISFNSSRLLMRRFTLVRRMLGLKGFWI